MKTLLLFFLLFLSGSAKSQDTLSLKLIFRNLTGDSLKYMPADTIFLSNQSGLAKYAYAADDIIFKGGSFFITNIPKGTYGMFVKGKQNTYFRNKFFPVICSQCKKEIVLGYTYREIKKGESVKAEEDNVFTEILEYNKPIDKKYQRKSIRYGMRHTLLDDFTKTWSKKEFNRISKKHFAITGFLSQSKNYSDIELTGDTFSEHDKILLIKSFSKLTAWHFTGEFVEIKIDSKYLFDENNYE